MHKDSDARRGNGGAIEIVMAIQLGPGGKFGIESGAAKEVQGEDGLWDKAIPQVEGKMFVDTAKAGDEMVFERPDGAFGGIATMDARRGKLKVDVLVAEELFERLGALVVQALEAWVESGVKEGSMEARVPRQDAGAGTILDGLRDDRIAVKVVE